MKPPPEEKLLRLIRGKAPRPAPAGGVGEPRTAPETAGKTKWTLDLRAGVRQLNWPKLGAGLLGLVLAAELAATLVQLARPLPLASLPVPLAFDEAPADSVAAPEIPSLAMSASRALFAAPAGQTAAPGPKRAALSEAAKQLASRLTLMGIVAGDPAQAIIEDAESKKTYFVTTGQLVADGAVLQQVLDNRVILELGGETIELTL